MPIQLFSEAADLALRGIISDLDYDLHKSIEVPEDGSEDGYPALTERFIQIHQAWAKDFGLI